MTTVLAWVPAAFLFLATVVVFFAPGFLTLWCLRLRWQLAVVAGPAVSVAIAGLGAVLAQPLHIPWNLLTMAGASAIAVAAAFVIGRVVGAPSRGVEGPDRKVTIAGIVGVVVALPVAVFPLMAGMLKPDAPSQAWDAVYHLNVLRHILQTGDASTFTIGVVAAPGARTGYYPAGWHDVVSLLSGMGIAESANIASLVIAGLIWTSGLALLAGVIFREHPAVAFFAPLVGSCYAAFPARMLTYGTLWPNALATSLVPALLALLILVLRRGQSARDRTRMLVAFVVALGGACLAHPTTVFAVGYLATPLFVLVGGRWVRSSWRRGMRIRATAVGVGAPVLVIVVLLGLSRTSLFGSVSAYPRAQTSTHAQAFGEALFDSMLGTTGYGTPTASWLLGALTVVGAVLAFLLRRHRWVVASWLISIGLYVLAMGPPGFLRTFVGFWYTDPVRLGGMVPLFAALLASWPLALIAEHIVAWGARRSWRPRTSAIVAFVAVVAVLAVATHGFRNDARRYEAYRDYARPLTASDGLLSRGEIAMLARLPDTLPAGAVVVGNPFNGSAYVMSLGDRGVVFPHLSGAWGPDRNYLMRHFSELGSDPEVCRILDRLHVRYAYGDSRLYYPDSPRQEIFSGLDIDVADPPPGLREIDRGGTAVLYAITACG